MNWTLFLSRIAWIANACFLASLWIMYGKQTIIPASIQSTLVVLGWMVAPVLNVTVLIIRFGYRNPPKPILLAKYYQVYLLFLIVQLLYITKIV
ncbi:MAG: hypothetical protein WCO43_07370 [Chitinophagia bacterium]